MATEPTIHVIDDDEAVRDSLAFLLEAAELKVAAHESADLFLEQAHAMVDGCIITDIRMPGMNGLELVKRLRAQGSQIPVIVITGHGDVPLAVEAMRAGVLDFIEKPFSDQTILGAVRRAIDLSHDKAEETSERNEIAQRLASLSGRERQVPARHDLRVRARPRAAGCDSDNCGAAAILPPPARPSRRRRRRAHPRREADIPVAASRHAVTFAQSRPPRGMSTARCARADGTAVVRPAETES